MTVVVAGVLGAGLLGLAVIVWPRRSSASAAFVDLAASDAEREAGGPGRHGGPAKVRSGSGSGSPTPSLWQQDPVDLYRRWRLRRRPGALVDDVLDLLRGIGPALGAGLTPSRAIELSAISMLGAERVHSAREATAVGDGRRSRTRSRNAAPPGLAGRSGARRDTPRTDIDRLVGALLDASERAEPAAPVWAAWAARSASAELAFVAAAWQLSETTGAPLASAVERAVRGLLDARARRGKVAVAVAGPRATVTVLTLLPLTGPVFGLACGIDPATLYLGSPFATACVVLGLGLFWVGRVWCTRMVRRAVEP